MRLFPILVLAISVLAAPAPLALVRPIISDSEGGAALPKSADYIPGETLFFSCRISGYKKTVDEKIHLTYSVEVFDPTGVALVELFKNDITDEVGPQDHADCDLVVGLKDRDQGEGRSRQDAALQKAGDLNGEVGGLIPEPLGDFDQTQPM